MKIKMLAAALGPAAILFSGTLAARAAPYVAGWVEGDGNNTIEPGNTPASNRSIVDCSTGSRMATVAYGYDGSGNYICGVRSYGATQQMNCPSRAITQQVFLAEDTGETLCFTPRQSGPGYSSCESGYLTAEECNVQGTGSCGGCYLNQRFIAYELTQ